MKAFVEWISQPWPWYVAGPMIGLMVPLLLILLNKSFGVSSSLRHFCAMCIPNRMEYFKYNWRAEGWNLLFVAAIAGGAWLATTFIPNANPVEISAQTTAQLQSMGIHDFTGLAPQDIFGWEQLGTPVSLIVLLIGGFLVGFGTRYANGCTSGHAIMGLSQLSPGSLVATVGFFIGGLIVSWWILPFILQLL